MKILFDMNHPADVHFFRWPIAKLKAEGHKVIVTSRHKDVAIDLLDEFQIEHRPISSLSGGVLALLGELFSRNYYLYKVVKKEQPDILVSVGGTFIAHVGFLTGVPSLVFYDTETAKLQNLITYPFATEIHVPDCYEAALPERKAYRYQGYQELSYLHPENFSWDRDIAEQCGVKKGTKNFFIRLVAWNANHDIGETGWNVDLLTNVVEKLSAAGNLIISSEAELPGEFSQWLYKARVTDIHHVMAACDLVVGESATVASEAAVLGVPAIYMAKTRLGYTSEEEEHYSLVKNIPVLEWELLSFEIDRILEMPEGFYQGQLKQLLDEKINVSTYVLDQIDRYNPNVSRK